MQHAAETLNTVASQAANAYATRYRMDADDLTNEAYIAVMLASKTYDPERGVPFRAYLWRAAVRCLFGYTAKQWSPVSGRDSRTLLKQHRSGTSPEQPTEPMQDIERFATLIRARITYLLKDLNIPDTDLALRVLLEGSKAREIADETGCPRRRVYNATYRLKQALKDDRVLQDLWASRWR